MSGLIFITFYEVETDEPKFSAREISDSKRNSIFRRELCKPVVIQAAL